jgi:hypothetical protein
MRRTEVLAAAALSAAVAVLASLATPVRAQEVSAQDRESAGQAYDRGLAAYAARDYPGAAQWFETAHRLAPASAALVEAVRAHERAGNQLRAATLALRLSALYPDERAAQRAAERALRHGARFVRVDVQCEGCTIQLDGTVMEHPSFFVDPGREHTLEAAFEHGTRRETLQGEAGDQRSVRFEAPPAPPPEPEVEPEPEAPTVAPSSGGIGVVPVWATLLVAGVTLVSAGVLIWSGIDTLDGVPAYEMDPTAERLADGQSRELRTNVLIGVTGALGVAALVLAILTDWDGEAPPVTAGLFFHDGGATASLAGRF